MKQRIVLLAGLASALTLVTLTAYGQYRTAYGYNPYTGRTAQGGAAYNPYTGTSANAARGYNPYTGREGAERTAYNPYTGRYAQGEVVHNPYTGRTGYAYRYGRR